MTFRTYLPIAAVRGHATRAWATTSPELHGLNAVKTDSYLYLLDDGRIVRQDWSHGQEKPSRHYVVFAPRGRKVTCDRWIAARVSPTHWRELPSFDVVGGR